MVVCGNKSVRSVKTASYTFSASVPQAVDVRRGSVGESGPADIVRRDNGAGVPLRTDLSQPGRDAGHALTQRPYTYWSGDVTWLQHGFGWGRHEGKGGEGAGRGAIINSGRKGDRGGYHRWRRAPDSLDVRGSRRLVDRT